MTEQPDTAAIRAGIFGNPAKVIYDLCDALDAARATSVLYAEMIGNLAEQNDRTGTRERKQRDRAKAAVAVTERLTGELDAAEARIAAALAACSDWETGDHWSPESLLRAVRRALTEGTSNGD